MNEALLSNAAGFAHIVPEIVLSIGSVLLFLLAGLSKTTSRRPKTLIPGAAVAVLMGAFAALLVYCKNGSWDQSCLKSGCRIFFDLLAIDPFSVFFRGLIITAIFIGVLLSIGSRNLPEDRKGEYHGLLLLMAVGMCFLSGADHLLMIYVALETVSLCSYLLTGWEEGRGRSHEAGLKYVLYGGVASAVMLFGMSLLYGLFGEMSLQGIKAAIPQSQVLQSQSGTWAATVALVLILAGLGYKIAAVPFHMWCPDVYQGAPTPFTAVLSVAPKAAGFAVIIRFLYSAFSVSDGMSETVKAAADLPWPIIIGVISAATMTLGNLCAIVQQNVKRLLAYSSIAHAGYILMGVTAGGEDGFIAVALYLSIYLIMNLGAFAVVALVEHDTGSEEISVYRGLGKRAPLLGVMMTVFLISLTGLPPTAGFIGKLYLFAALLKNGEYWYFILALFGILNSVISLYYYARIMKAMYFEQSSDSTQATQPLTFLRPTAAVAVVLCIATVIFGIYFQPLAVAAKWSSVFLH